MKKVRIKELVEKIEGEAELEFDFVDGVIDNVEINFGFYRGIEEILQGRDPMDALVITPRVCGICNHAHLIAAVTAIEDGYKNGGLEFELSNKAKYIREFTLSCELIQNHAKWFYITIIPQLEALLGVASGQNHPLKANYISTTITKALAIFAGQWPHSSYVVPGGVTCDPTYLEVVQADSLIDEVIRFFEQVVVGIDMQTYLGIDTYNQLNTLEGDFGRVLHLLRSSALATLGQSHDRFIVLGESSLAPRGKAVATTVSNVDLRYVAESEQKGSKAKAAHYKGKFYEVGPLSRAMLAKRGLIKSLHKRHKDSIFSRIFARIDEIALLLQRAKQILHLLSLDEPSCVLDMKKKPQNFSGSGAVEAARGSLLHRLVVEDSKIKNYDIITPTQWNLSCNSKEETGIAIKAMQGLKGTDEAKFVFRTFDVCSVCTTQ